jgi:hypothetical protein
MGIEEPQGSEKRQPIKRWGKSKEISRIMESEEAQKALNDLLDKPLDLNFLNEPGTFRKILVKYKIPIPTLGKCTIELDVPSPGFVRLTLPQLYELPSELGAVLADTVKNINSIEYKY